MVNKVMALVGTFGEQIFSRSGLGSNLLKMCCRLFIEAAVSSMIIRSHM